MPNDFAAGADDEARGDDDEASAPKLLCTGCGSCNVVRVAIDKTPLVGVAAHAHRAARANTS